MTHEQGSIIIQLRCQVRRIQFLFNPSSHFHSAGLERVSCPATVHFVYPVVLVRPRILDYCLPVALLTFDCSTAIRLCSLKSLEPRHPKAFAITLFLINVRALVVHPLSFDMSHVGARYITSRRSRALQRPSVTSQATR